MTDDFNIEQIASIRRQVETLMGQDIGEQGEAMVVMARALCRSLCCRQDVPADMEPAVALCARWMLENGGDGVKTVQRGDTSVTYEEDIAFIKRLRSLLAPFCRLGSVT